MDKKFTIEVHIGEDYVRFTVGKKENEWPLKNGLKMLKMFQEFLKLLV